MESVALSLLGVVVIVVGLAASIALHEIGHLVPAKRFGVKCTQYMVGFGPTVWSVRRGETEYGIKGIPLGGYVRMLGMIPPKPGERPRADSTGRIGLLVDQARRDAQREIGPEDDGRLFYQRSVPKRIVIMLGGPVMNLLIAVALFTFLLAGIGSPEPTTTVSRVSECVLAMPETGPMPTQCPPDAPKTPAAEAGVRPGDRIVSFAGQQITSWDVLQGLIRTRAGQTVDLVVERDGRPLTLSVTPVRNRVQTFDELGRPVTDEAGRRVVGEVGFLGVSPGSVRVTTPLSEMPGQIAGFTAQTVSVVARLPEKMVGIVQAVSGNGTRDPNGPISVVGVGRIAGEVGAADGALADKAATWVALLASVNLALFVFNLLPLLPLDGGHVAGALWEAARRRVNRLLRRPDPGPVDIARLLPLTYAVASVLLVMSALLIYADIVNPISLTG